MSNPRTYLAIAIVTSLLALGALGSSVALFLGKTGQIQTSRRESARDSCLLFKRIILASGSLQHKTAQAERFLVSNRLVNCTAYGEQITKLK